MNTFILDRDPKTAARLQCDQHACKMPTEYAQMMSTAHRVIDGQEYIGRTAKGRRVKRWDLSLFGNKEEHAYKATHVNHPANIWVRESTQHYEWFYQLWFWTAKEYERRYGREHATVGVVFRAGLAAPPTNLYDNGWTEPPACMPEEFVTKDIVESYRNFYRGSKSRFARYKMGAPEFMKDVL